MPTWDKSKSLDISNHRAVIGAIDETVKLRVALKNKWVSSDRLILFLDKKREDRVSYAEFHDGLSQFGLTEEIDVDKVFAYMTRKNPNPNQTSVSVGDILEALQLTTALEACTTILNEVVLVEDKHQQQEHQQQEHQQNEDDQKELNQGSNTSTQSPARHEEEDLFAISHHSSRVIHEIIADNNEEEEELINNSFPPTLLVGLVAHNDLKPSMLSFVQKNVRFFSKVRLVTTGSTGRALSLLGLEVDTLVSSGPLGGDQEIGSMIVKGEVAALFFFTDPLSSHPHETDVAALNRICCVHDTMFASNPSTAQALVYALEHSAFGFSRLTGANPDYLKKDSSLVEYYKRKQQKVIQDVSTGHDQFLVGADDNEKTINKDVEQQMAAENEVVKDISTSSCIGERGKEEEKEEITISTTLERVDSSSLSALSLLSSSSSSFGKTRKCNEDPRPGESLSLVGDDYIRYHTNSSTCNKKNGMVIKGLEQLDRKEEQNPKGTSTNFPEQYESGSVVSFWKHDADPYDKQRDNDKEAVKEKNDRKESSAERITSTKKKKKNNIRRAVIRFLKKGKVSSPTRRSQ